ncbi:hypothetical protein P3S68_007277 [Capsicum galapagoense]
MLGYWSSSWLSEGMILTFRLSFRKGLNSGGLYKPWIHIFFSSNGLILSNIVRNIIINVDIMIKRNTAEVMLVIS